MVCFPKAHPPAFLGNKAREHPLNSESLRECYGILSSRLNLRPLREYSFSTVHDLLRQRQQLVGFCGQLALSVLIVARGRRTIRWFLLSVILLQRAGEGFRQCGCAIRSEGSRSRAPFPPQIIARLPNPSFPALHSYKRSHHPCAFSQRQSLRSTPSSDGQKRHIHQLQGADNSI